MIDRFDFYDLYAYLVPGAALLMVLWLPFGLVAHEWPSAELADAVLFVILAYVVGLLLHGLATNAFSEQRLHRGGRYPSDFLLDSTNPFFGEKKTELIDELSDLSGNNVASVPEVSASETAIRRNRAFLMCRTMLRKKELASYAEHFQGLYGLMRGLTATCFAGAAYYAGWATGPFGSPWWASLAAALVVVVLLVIFVVGESPALSYWWGLAGAFPAGLYLSMRIHASVDQSRDLFVAALFLLAIATRSYVTYRYWTIKFAETVYLDFFAVRKGKL